MSTVKRRTRPRPVAITHAGSVRVTSSAFNVDDEERRDIEIVPFLTEPAYVRINAGTTKNLGNYESLRVDVSVTIPCYVEEITEVTARVSDEVAALLNDELRKWNVE